MSAETPDLPALTALPALVVHCDWGTAPDKRWMAKATLVHGQYIAYAPELVGDLPTLLSRIAEERGPASSALVGFDFPIGVPAMYAANVGVSDFPALLTALGKGKWQHFFELCRKRDEISVYRPFYPFNFTPKGSKSPRHLVESLRLNTATDLLRICDQPRAQRTAAGALFWTLGAKAPGRGALLGWQHVLQPATGRGAIRLWPFQGTLPQLLQLGTTVIAEAYPAEYYTTIFGQLNGSKRDQSVRAAAGPKTLHWAANLPVSLQFSPVLESEIKAGFNNGEDAFDAAIGLFGMIDAIQNFGPHLEPIDPTIRNIEGWILGQPAP
jgi:hypothetical protein